MEKIIFLSDSPTDFEPEDTAGAPYKMVPSSLIYDDGRIIRENEVDRWEYYDYLKTCKTIPSTAMGTPEQWLEAFTEAAANGYTHAVIYTISSTASSVYQSINLAYEMFEAEQPGALVIEWIDSRQYSMVYGRLLLESIEQSRQGWGFRKIADDLRQRTARNQAVIGTYSLRCMQKSGRISGMAAFMGGALGIRPVLLAQNGVIAPVEKVRGEKNLVPTLVKHIKARIVNPEEQELVLIHGSIPPGELDRMESLLYKELRPKNIIRHTIGVTVVTNCGPETIGIAYFGEPY
ncbi:MAG: DegV family EDD domain-containing protein [Oscillospiraceae bacterium]|nr:DegV family EDD domain-containing protein [Oscillospiraceae bacterium]